WRARVRLTDGRDGTVFAHATTRHHPSRRTRCIAWFGRSVRGRRPPAAGPPSKRRVVEASPTARYATPMLIDLSNAVEEQLRHLAEREGRDVRIVLEDAVRQYAEAASITDLDADDVGETQLALASELPAHSDWKAPRK